MAIFKKYLLFFISLIALVLLAIGGLVIILMLSGKTSAASDKMQSAESSLRAALSLQPAPTEANLEASIDNVQNLEDVLKTQVESTKGRNAQILEQTPPPAGTDMYYDLLAYKNELDKDAKVIQPFGVEQPGVAVPEDFDWGFSRFLQAGAGSPPPEDAIPELFRQKIILNYLLRKLLATGPQSIVSVQREPVTLQKQAPATNSRNTGNSQKDKELKSDEFWIAAESAAVPGIVETTAFKIAFTGYSQNLRSFLIDIASFELPLVVRSVEVKPAEKVATDSRNEPQNDIFSIFGGGNDEAEPSSEVIEQNQEPVVDTNVSEFTVVIEFIDVTIKS